MLYPIYVGITLCIGQIYEYITAYKLHYNCNSMLVCRYRDIVLVRIYGIFSVFDETTVSALGSRIRRDGRILL